MMNALIAVGGFAPSTDGRFDVLPLVVILVSLAVVRLALGIQLRWGVVLGVVIGGTFLGGAIEAWGFAIPTAVALAVGAIASAVLHRQARRA
jgi:hypothetical protein